jgi:amino acid adenylation domain-containing protein
MGYMRSSNENDVTNNEPESDSSIMCAQAKSGTSIINRTSVINGGRVSTAATIPKVEFRRDLPLSFAQERLWFLAQMEGASKAYQRVTSLHLRGELDRIALRQALNQIVARHEALRTVFTLVDGSPVQRIISKHESQFRLIEHDMRECDQAAEELNRLIDEEASTPFDLEAGPLIRARLIRQTEQDHILLITIHHIVSDAWSFGVFSNELSELYSAYVRGEADPLPGLSVQYADYAVWQRKWVEGQILQEQAEYWKTALAGAPALLQLPTDHIRPAQQSYSGAFAKLALDEELTVGLKELGRRHGTTLFMTLLAGWAALLARLSGQQDVVIGTPVAGRRRLELENLIGFFVNTLSLRLHVSDSLSVGKLLAHVRSQVIAAQRHQDIPFERVVDVIRPARSLAHSPVFQVVFAWQNAPRRTIDLPGLQVSQLPIAPHAVSKFDLTLSLHEENNKIVGIGEYATALFERATVERYWGYFRELLQAMVSDDTQEVGRLHILPERERRRVLCEWNATDAEYPREKCVHELFEEQARKTPEEVALVCEGMRLTYGELNARANQLARHLQALGIEAGERVAVLLRHSPEVVISMLAALKAGCAYVPLDPFTPKARAAFILKDSRAAALLAQQELLEGLSERPAKAVCVDGYRGEIERQEAGDLGTRVGAESLAYALYTSGSTGDPKGVEVRHRALVNYVWWAKEVYLQGERLAFPFYTSLAFDLTLTSIFAPLLSGGRIIVYPTERRGTPLDRILQENQVDVVKLTPSHLSLIKDQDNRQSRIRRLIVGGEALDTALARQVYESFGGVEIYNEYGPTEATVGCMIHRYDPDVDRRAFVPIGRPAANTQIYILDGRLEPVAENVVGEIYIAGACLAEGYLNREELTAEAFIDNPFDRGRKMYRSGDLGRRLPEGVMEYVGRRDEQVKYHGYRVELGEIRSLLNRRAQIRDSVVRVKKDQHGQDVLVAYYVSRQELGAKEIREYLLENLAEEALPSVYVHLKKMPLTLNGKVDYEALPSLEEADQADRGWPSDASRRGAGWDLGADAGIGAGRGR